jgi:hypothetical protein
MYLLRAQYELARWDLSNDPQKCNIWVVMEMFNEVHSNLLNNLDLIIWTKKVKLLIFQTMLINDPWIQEDFNLIFFYF